MTSLVINIRIGLNNMLDSLAEPNVAITFGLVLALGIIAAVKRFLDTSGIIAAGIIGIIVGIGGHWTWLAILLIFLVAGSFATRWSYEEKDAMGLAEAREGARNWTNVIANGGAPALVSMLAWLSSDSIIWAAPFLAAVAVASADTLASEFGVLDPRVRMIISGKHVAAGTNGGTSPTGQLAAAGGSLLITFLGCILFTTFSEGFDTDIVRVFCVVSLMGWTGCQIDSILGALFENRGLMTKGQVNLISIAFGAGATYLLLGLV